MQAITKGLEKVEQELSISEKDPPETEIFYKVGFPVFQCRKAIRVHSDRACDLKRSPKTLYQA